MPLFSVLAQLTLPRVAGCFAQPFFSQPVNLVLNVLINLGDTFVNCLGMRFLYVRVVREQRFKLSLTLGQRSQVALCRGFLALVRCNFVVETFHAFSKPITRFPQRAQCHHCRLLFQLSLKTARSFFVGGLDLRNFFVKALDCFLCLGNLLMQIWNGLLRCRNQRL